MKLERTLMAGSGGQGIVLLGKLFASAALKDTPHVTFFPSYGAEVRGGTSNCQVILSSAEISSPVADTFESMILMNQESLQRFLPKLAAQGLAVVNSSLCKAEASARVALVPATEEAEKLGDARVANLVMLGTLIAHRRVVAPEDIEESIRNVLEGRPLTIVDLNLAAFRSGLGKP
jgi:2-oxoglutarate ferredoxin oxidoreductase subunit gamma